MSWRYDREAGVLYEGGVPASCLPGHSREVPLLIRLRLTAAWARHQGGELLDVVPGPQARDGGLVGWPGLGEQFG